MFGSYANGKPDDGSDLDLCIIVDSIRKRKVEILKSIRRALAQTVTMPVDLLVYAVEEFNEKASVASTMEYKIKNEGILVYEQ